MKRWSWPQYLAAVGIPILIWNAWTIVAWLADGPSQVVAFRDRGAGSWTAARAYELALVVISVAVLVHVVRTCVQRREFLTLDVMYCLCGATILWNDVGGNVVQPYQLFSSQWVNLNSPCGHMPFVVNPDCGRAPDPVLFTISAMTFGVLGAALVMAPLVNRARTRWPRLSLAQILGLLVVAGFLIDLGLEVPAVSLGLWTYGPTPIDFPLGRYRFPLLEVVCGGLFFGLMVALRILRNDRGETLVEQGLAQYAARRRKAISLLALYAVFQLVAWIPGTLPIVALGFFQRKWEPLPAHLVNGICDAPGFSATRYGPCPGSPGFRLPGRHSLPGESP